MRDGASAAAAGGGPIRPGSLTDMFLGPASEPGAAPPRPDSPNPWENRGRSAKKPGAPPQDPPPKRPEPEPKEDGLETLGAFEAFEAFGAAGRSEAGAGPGRPGPSRSNPDA